MAKNPNKPHRAIQVFVSYSRHASQVDRVQAITKWLEELGGGQIRFITDMCLRPGDNVHHFERSVRFYEFCLIMGTPEYKRKIESGDYGVSRELVTILARHEEHTLHVIPAILDSSFSESFPQSISSPLAIDFSGLLHDSNTGMLGRFAQTKYAVQGKALVDRILDSHHRRPNIGENNLAEIRKRLFFEPKHEELSKQINDEMMDVIFVKTSFYSAVKNEKAYLLIGRKGSGKSFLTDYFIRHSKDDNTIPVNIHLRIFRLANIYLMKSSSNIKSDIGSIISQRDLFECVWCAFLTVSAMTCLYMRIRAGRAEQYVTPLEEIGRLVDAPDLCFYEFDPVSKKESVQIQALMDWCGEKIFDNINRAISGLSGDYAKAVAQIPSFVDPVKAVTAIIGRPALNAFWSIIKDVKPKFLFTVDGFDSKFDSFRSETNLSGLDVGEKQSRVKFEVDWIAGLVEGTGRFINSESRNFAFPPANSSDFLITLPRDRFSEFRRSDRDAYRLRHRYVEIRWSGKELMNLVRKRLEIYFGYQAAANQSITVRFKEAFAKIGRMPLLLEFSFNGSRISIDLFYYMLRHTFWRPRDVLYYVAELLRVSDWYEKTNRRITVDVLRRKVSGVTTDVIETEFYGEFQSIFPSIREYVGLFRRGEIEMSYSEIYSLIGSADIKLSSGDVVDGFEAKLDFLYEIGFLGVVLTASGGKRLGFARREAFSFSDSLDAYRRMDSKNKTDCRWVVHPIFVEELQLITANTEFLLHYDDAYIELGDA